MGGPIKKDMAFFFVNFEEFRLPQVHNSGAVAILKESARQGVFTYRDSGGVVRNVNLYQIVAAKNPTLPGSVRQYATSPDPTLMNCYNLVSRLTTAGTGSIRSRVPTSNDYNRNEFNFQTPANDKRHFTTQHGHYGAVRHGELSRLDTRAEKRGGGALFGPYRKGG